MIRGNVVYRRNFHTRKLGDIAVSHEVFTSTSSLFLAFLNIHVHRSKFDAFDEENPAQRKSIGKMPYLFQLLRVRQTDSIWAG